MARTALITGISGQDGAYLARLLLGKGYRVLGSASATNRSPLSRLTQLRIAGDVEIVELDLFDQSVVVRTLERLKPDELYNLAAQSLVSVSFGQPLHTAQVNAIAPARLLEAIRMALPEVRFYQASTSEMFGLAPDPDVPRTERHPFHPRSPYGVAKAYAHWLTVNYRESYGLFAVSGILFNHESPLRGPGFVTRKITSGMVEIRRGVRDVLTVGNFDVRRDWGFAGDYVDGMWRMLQQDDPDDFILATGESRSLRQFVELAGEAVGYSIQWAGEGDGERAVDRRSGRTLVALDPAIRRPADIPGLVGDPSKAKSVLGWTARTAFPDLVRMMAEADLSGIPAKAAGTTDAV